MTFFLTFVPKIVNAFEICSSGTSVFYKPTLFIYILQQSFLERIYGKCMTKNSSTTNGNLIIESAELLKFQQQQQQKREELQRKMSTMSESLNDSHMSNTSTSTMGSPF